jgi:proline iminopeptidase
MGDRESIFGIFMPPQYFLNFLINKTIFKMKKTIVFLAFCLVANVFTLFLGCTTENQKGMSLSPSPPSQALTTSLPPQQAPLPPAPNKQELKQGYFQGEDGVQLFYRIVGSGKDTLVFVHGGPIGIEDAALDYEIIAERGYTFISYDERGCGRSELVKDSTKLTMSSFVADLEALRKHFNINKLSLAGVSWGAGICSFYAYEFPNNVQRMALISPVWTNDIDKKQREETFSSHLGEETNQKIRKIDSLWTISRDDELQGLWKSLDSLIASAYVLVPSHFDRARGTIYTYSPLALKSIYSTLVYCYSSFGEIYDFRPMLKQINVPTIVIEGEKTLVPKEATMQYVYNIKNSKMVWIPNAGHSFWLDQPKAAIDTLDNFLKSTPRF